MENQKNKPQLRFPGFNDKWESKRLGEVINPKSGKYNPERDNTSYKCIELEHLDSESGMLLGYVDSVNSGSIKNKFEKGNVLFGKLRPYLKKYLQAPFNGVCSSEIWVLKGIDISNDFLYRVVQTNSFIELANQSSGSKMPRADWSVVANGVFAIPSLSEQTKIASFFTILDEKITELKQKKSLLEQYKKGVMQKLFSRDLRFKDDDGMEFPKWEKKKLGEVAIIRSGLSKEQNGDIEGCKVTRIETISDGTINLDKIGFISIDNEIDEYKLKKGDILFSNINSVSHIGKIAIAYSDLDLYHGMNLLCLKSFKNTSPFYLYYLLNTVKLRNYFKRICNQAVSQASINQTELAKTQISLPCLEEQTKIANFLSVIDEKINHTQFQMQQTEQYKKGLLQQMFC